MENKGIDGLKKFLEKNSGVPAIGIGGMDAIVNGSNTPLLTIPSAQVKRGRKGDADPVKQAGVVLHQRLLTLTNEFYQFYKNNKTDIDKCADKIVHLNGVYQNWLKINDTIYDYAVCENYFIERMDGAFDSSMLEIQMNQAMAKIRENEKRSE